MIDEEIKIALNEKHGELNFKGLLEHMETSGVDFKAKKLKGPMGFATNFGIYLDLDKIDEYHEKILFFVILHEMAHYKRIVKIGFNRVLEILSFEDFEKFCNHVVTEEIIADRYGSLVYYLLNRELYPKEATQQLEQEPRKEKYKETAKYMFGVVKNKEENYRKLWESFIV